METQNVRKEKSHLGFEVGFKDLGAKSSLRDELYTNNLTLDVGCGNNGRGDVNCDLFPYSDSGHRSGKHGSPCDIPNFVMCDAMHLPFKNGSFSEVFSSHVIEHVQNSFFMLNEMVRVSSKTVIVKCPHRYGDRAVIKTRKWRKRFHINHLNINWFKKAADKLNCGCACTYSSWYYIPHAMFSLFKFPYEITAVLTKRKRKIKP